MAAMAAPTSTATGHRCHVTAHRRVRTPVARSTQHPRPLRPVSSVVADTRPTGRAIAAKATPRPCAPRAWRQDVAGLAGMSRPLRPVDNAAADTRPTGGRAFAVTTRPRNSATSA